jgi:hypothetical protein
MSKTGLAFLAAMAAMTGVAQANCSNLTIRGDYVFTLHGQGLTPDGTTSTGLLDGVGVISFDGHGKLVQEDFVVRNGTQVPGGPPNPSGFHTGETGTYSVNADCTGNANIVLGPGNERALALVISKSAQTIHAVVSSAVIGGQPGVAQVHSDFERIND